MPKMTDAQLIDKAKREAELKAEIRKLSAEAKTIGEAVIAEVARRKSEVTTDKGDKVAGFERGGVRVLVLVSTTTTYDVDKARKKVGEGKFRKLAHWAISKKSVEACIEAGVITADDVEAFSEKSTSAPYLRTSTAKVA
jgi:hypothetical protein